MQYKDTSQQTFLFRPIYFIIYLFIFYLVDLGELLIWKVDPHAKKMWAPLLYYIPTNQLQNV